MDYQKFLDDMVDASHALSEADLAALAAALSTAESRILAAMAGNYPSVNVKNNVDRLPTVD